MAAGDEHAMRKAKKRIVGKPDLAGLVDFFAECAATTSAERTGRWSLIREITSKNTNNPIILPL